MRQVFILLLVFVLVLSGNLLASAGELEPVPFKRPLDLRISHSSALDVQPDTILFDDGNTASFYPQNDYWCSIRFTAPSTFILNEIYMLLIDGSFSTATCDIYIYGSNGPTDGQELATTVIPAPLPQFGWAQGNLGQPVEIGAGEDFYVVFGPVPGGSQGTTGYKPILDPGTTEYRGARSYDGQFGTYIEVNSGDFMVRAGGILDPQADIAATQCFNETSSGTPSFNMLPGEEVMLHSEITNIGNANIDAFSVLWTVEGPSGVVFSETIDSTNLAKDESIAIPTTTSFTVTEEGEYLVSCLASTLDDLNMQNNETFLRFFVGGNNRWYRYNDNEAADIYYSFSTGSGWGLSFTPTQYPAKVGVIRVNVTSSGAGVGDFRIYLNDSSGEPTGDPVWSIAPAVVAGWNQFIVDPAVELAEGESFTVASLYQTGVRMECDNDPPDRSNNEYMPATAWLASNNGSAWYADETENGNTCIQAFIDDAGTDSLYFEWDPESSLCECFNVYADEDSITHVFVGPFASYCVAEYPDPIGNGWVHQEFDGGHTICPLEECPDGEGVAWSNEPPLPFGDPVLGNWVDLNGLWYRHFEFLVVQPGCVALCLDYAFSIFSIDCWLPVELLSFEAVPGDREITLNWQTASETDNERFEIERNGTIVGTIEADNSATGSSYHWTEENLVNGREYSYTLYSVSVSGEREEIGTASATPRRDEATVSEYALHQNYPNPFNPETNIVFDLVETGEVLLTIYNAQGQTVETLVEGQMSAGRHTIGFDAKGLPSGLYFCRMEAGEFRGVRKMVMMK